MHLERVNLRTLHGRTLFRPLAKPLAFLFLVAVCAGAAHAAAGNRNHAEIAGLQGKCEKCHDHMDKKHMTLVSKSDCGLCHPETAKKKAGSRPEAKPEVKPEPEKAAGKAPAAGPVATERKAKKERKAEAPESAAPVEAAAPASESASAPDAEPAPAPAGFAGRAACLACHAGSLEKTVHGRLPEKILASGKMECESCHGPGAAHAEGDVEKIVRRPAPEAVRKMCAACHPKDRAQSAAWRRGVHNVGEGDCLTCHEFHGSKQPSLLKKPVNETCLACHPQTKAEFARPYRHPVNEGGVTCASCHDAHTEKRGFARPEERSDVCLTCHSEIRGPFMFEHKAVSEEKGCLNCHQPHGGSAPKLLRQVENALCLQCHQGVFATGAVAAGFSKATIEHSRMPAFQNRCGTCHTLTPAFNPAAPGHYNKVGFDECSNCHGDFKGIDHTKFLTRGRCLDCHTDIHGSNHNRSFLE